MVRNRNTQILGRLATTLLITFDANDKDELRELRERQEVKENKKKKGEAAVTAAKGWADHLKEWVRYSRISLYFWTVLRAGSRDITGISGIFSTAIEGEVERVFEGHSVPRHHVRCARGRRRSRG